MRRFMQMVPRNGNADFAKSGQHIMPRRARSSAPPKASNGRGEPHAQMSFYQKSRRAGRGYLLRPLVDISRHGIRVYMQRRAPTRVKIRPARDIRRRDGQDEEVDTPV